MSDQSIPVSVLLNPVIADPTTNRDEMMRRFNEGVQRELAEQLAAGYTIYYGGTGDGAGKLFMHTPDGRRFEYRVLEDGTREIVREIAK